MSFPYPEWWPSPQTVFYGGSGKTEFFHGISGKTEVFMEEVVKPQLFKETGQKRMLSSPP